MLLVWRCSLGPFVRGVQRCCCPLGPCVRGCNDVARVAVLARPLVRGCNDVAYRAERGACPARRCAVPAPLRSRRGAGQRHQKTFESRPTFISPDVRVSPDVYLRRGLPGFFGTGGGCGTGTFGTDAFWRSVSLSAISSSSCGLAPFVATTGGGSGHGFKHGPLLGKYVADRVGGKDGDPELARLFALAGRGEI